MTGSPRDSTATAMTLLSLGDVARLARVQRPVVSGWRRRYAGRDDAFPMPITVKGQRALFNADDVVDWIARTGLGNNPSVRDDLGAHQPLPEVDGAFQASTALLTIMALGHAVPGTLGELRSLVLEADPDDEVLRREMDGIVHDRLTSLTDDAAARVEASWGAVKALEVLARARSRLAPQALQGGPLTAAGTALLADMIEGIAFAVAAPKVIDATGYLDDVALALGDEQRPMAVSVLADHPIARLTRRRLSARDGMLSSPRATSDTGDTLVVWRVPPVEADAGAVLAALTDALGDQQPGTSTVIIGPSSILLDDLRDPVLQGRRADIARDPRLRCVTRLPRGIMTAHPRSHLAVMVFAGSRTSAGVVERAPRAEGSVAESAIFDLVHLIDLDGIDLDPDLADRLIDDVVASLSPRRLESAHAFTYGTWMPRSAVAARSRALVPLTEASARPAPSKLPHAVNADAAVELGRLIQPLGEHVSQALSDLVVAPSVDPQPRLVLGRLIDDGYVRMLSGVRLDARDITENGVPVISADDVRRGRVTTNRAVPVLVQQGAYRRAALTRVGDVVITTRPAAAWIDRRGRSLVEAPARILRLVDGARARLTPELLAAAVNGADATIVDWHRWVVSPAPSDQRERLGAALEILHERRLELRQHLEQLESAHRLLTDGVRDSALLFPLTTPDTDLEGGA